MNWFWKKKDKGEKQICERHIYKFTPITFNLIDKKTKINCSAGYSYFCHNGIVEYSNPTKLYLHLYKCKVCEKYYNNATDVFSGKNLLSKELYPDNNNIKILKQTTEGYSILDVTMDNIDYINKFRELRLESMQREKGNNKIIKKNRKGKQRNGNIRS